MSTSNPISPLMQTVLYGLDHDLFNDQVGHALLQIFHAGVCDQRIAAMIQGRVKRHQVAQAFSGSTFRTPQLPYGEIVCGFGLDGNPLRYPLQHENAHALTVAGSGAGKTNKTLFRALQIAPRVRGTWLFDFRKREFRVLRPLLARISVNMMVVPARRLRINPLQVPRGVSPMDWASRVADMLIQVLCLPPRASKLTQTTVAHLYRHHGILDGGQSFPTLFDLREAVAQNHDANTPAKEAIIDSLDPVLGSLGPAVLGYRYAWPSYELARRHLAYEFGGIAEVEKDLLLNTLVLSEFTSRIAQGISNPRMDLWISADEAQRLCAARGSGSGGAVADLIGLVRGTGIGLDLSVQSAAAVAHEVVSNSAIKNLGRCGAAGDYAAIGSSMGLSAEDIHWCQLHLQPGMFVGQLGEGNWRRPFAFQVPLMQFGNPHGEDPGIRQGGQVSNVHLLEQSTADAPTANSAQSMHGLDDGLGLDELLALPLVPAEEFTDWEARQPQAANAPASPSTNSALSEAELKYLRVVIEQPGKPSSVYPKLAGIGTRRAQAIRDRLISAGYLRQHRVATGQRGRDAIVLEPLDAAREAVARQSNQTTGGGR